MINYKKPAFWMIALATIAIIAVGVMLVSNPMQKISLYELSEGIEFSMHEDAQGGYAMRITNNSPGNIYSCSLEIYSNSRVKDGSKNLFTSDNFDINSESSIDIKIINFNAEQYMRFQGYNGIIKKKENMLTKEGNIQSLCNPVRE